MIRVSLSPTPQLLGVDQVRRSADSALLGNYMNMLPQAGMFEVSTHSVGTGRQVIYLAGCAKLEPDNFLRVASAPLLQVPVSAVERSDTPKTIDTAVSMIYLVRDEPPPEVPAIWDEGQRDSFLRARNTLPLHLRGN